MTPNKLCSYLLLANTAMPDPCICSELLIFPLYNSISLMLVQQEGLSNTIHRYCRIQNHCSTFSEINGQPINGHRYNKCNDENLQIVPVQLVDTTSDYQETRLNT